MEIELKTDFIKENICKRCLFIFKNIVKINSRTDMNETEDTKYLNINKEEHEKTQKNENLFNINNIENYSDNDDFLCKFCMGILDEKRYKDIIDMIADKIKEFQAEHSNFKLTTNFSALFLMIHTYVI